MIVVNKMGKKYGMDFKEGEDTIRFVFSQLDYHRRSKVSSHCTFMKEGKLMLDAGLACFYNLKYALKDVTGLFDEDEQPYKLEFEAGHTEEDYCLTDDCVDELLATDMHHKLVYAARDLGARVPEEITHPITGEKLEGVEIVPPSKLKNSIEKK